MRVEVGGAGRSKGTDKELSDQCGLYAHCQSMSFAGGRVRVYVWLPDIAAIHADFFCIIFGHFGAYSTDAAFGPEAWSGG